MKKKIIFCMILILLGSSLLITNVLIGRLNWHLRADFIWLASYMLPLGVILLVTFLLHLVKNNGIRVFLIVVWILISLVFLAIETMLLGWIVKDTPIKEIDGVKYCSVEYYSNRLRKDVYYYKEYNIFAYHETKEYIEEFYEHDDYMHPIYRIYKKENVEDNIMYDYDKEGNITKVTTYDKEGNKKELEK